MVELVICFVCSTLRVCIKRCMESELYLRALPQLFIDRLLADGANGFALERRLIGSYPATGHKSTADSRGDQESLRRRLNRVPVLGGPLK